MLAGLSFGLLFVIAISIIAIADTRHRIAELAANSEIIDTRSGPLEYSRWGDGDPVLVIHGAGGGFDQGRLLAEAIGGKDAEFIAVSRFGYLRSELPIDASIEAQAAALHDLLDALGIERISILAMSGGVPSALKLAELYPGRIDRMVLLSSAPFTPFRPQVEDRPMPTWLYSALLSNDVIYWCLAKTARRQLAAAFDARADLLDSASAKEKAFVDKLIDGFLPASRRVRGVNNEGAAVAPAARYNLEQISADVLLVHARDDELNPFAVAEAIAERIPSIRFIQYETGGHLLLGHHAELNDEIPRFLSE